MVNSTDANGNVTTYTYDDRGNVLTKTEAVGTPEERTTTYSYHPDYDLITSITKASISNPSQTTVTTFTYDAMGNLLERTETGFSGTNPISKITTYTYNSLGQMTSTDGPRIHLADVTFYEYYLNEPAEGLNRGTLKKVIDPFGFETLFSQYNAYGKPGEMIDANGVVSTLDYDSSGWLISRTTAGISTAFEYNEVGNLTAIFLPGGRKLTSTYTDANLLKKLKDDFGNYIEYFYDTEGNRVREEIYDRNDHLRRHVAYLFDEFSRLRKTIYPNGHFEERSYDGNGNLVYSIDPKSNPTLYEYDHLNHLTIITQPGDITTSYSYDSHDNLTSVTNAETGLITYLYDDLGRLIATTSPDTGTTSYAYDEADNLSSKTDANGNTVTYVYDALNRLTEIHYPDSSQNITYTYDGRTNGKGRLTDIADPSGREIKVVEDQNFTVEYFHNDNGDLIGITYPSGRTVIYDRDISGQIVAVHSTYNGNTTTLAENMGYLPFGPKTGMTLGNGLDISNIFDRFYRLESSQVGSVYNRSYSYDPVGNISRIEDIVDFSASQSLGYDPLNRLISATGKYGSVSFTYDKVGNRLTRTVNSVIEAYTYAPDSNLLISVESQNPAIFTYDDNGNTTGMGNKTFLYNQNNRLVEAFRDGLPIDSYRYNAQGQRVKKSANGNLTLFIYDKKGHLISEADNEGNVLREYIYLSGTRLAYFAYDKPTEIEVEVTTNKGRKLAGTRVYAFNGSGRYRGLRSLTDDEGVAYFALEDFDEGYFIFRVDYLSYQFWSPVIKIPGTYEVDVVIDEETAEIAVTVAGEAKEDVKVYLFSETGSYLGLYRVTDKEGKVSFDLPVGQVFMFRADYTGKKYWSDATLIGSGDITHVDLDTGGGTLTVTIQKDDEQPIVGVKVSLFSPSGSYLGWREITDENGQVSFFVSEGKYKVRAKYLGHRFWTEIISVYSDVSPVLVIPHRDVIITVEGDCDGGIIPVEGIKVFLFNPSGSYLKQYQMTDEQGQVTFSLPFEDFKVRASYMRQKYWSEIFNGTDQTVTINEGIAEVHMKQGFKPIENAKIQVFNLSDSHLRLSAQTDEEGIAQFRLPKGTYKFRGHYQRNKYWVTEMVRPHQINKIDLDTGGGIFTLTVEEEEGSPIVNVPIYAFTATGRYIRMNSRTDEKGQVTLGLPDGGYMFRVDYLGYKFWTDDYTVFNNLSDTMTIPHQDVTITVNKVYDTTVTPLENVKVSLFNPSGSYLKQYQMTDERGQVTFSLPFEDYKVRAGYMRRKYWSETFDWQSHVEVDIEHGLVDLHVSQNGEDVSDARVYLFSESGSYLKKYEWTDYHGNAEFIVPEGSYKFRVNYDGVKYWSDAVNVIPHDETSVELALERLASNPTNDPHPVRFDGKPPVYEPYEIRVASIGSLAGILSQTALAAIPSPELYYYINDHLGTPQVITDENGEVVWKADYLPFGEAKVDPSSMVNNNFRFPGQYFDEETGLHYNWHRYYDPRTGRYLTPDPLHLGNVQVARQNFQTVLYATMLYQYALSNPQALNDYGYVHNNPVNWTDPIGLIGFGFSGGGAYGSGGGLRDPHAYSASAGSGFYIGVKEGGRAEIGGFSYQAEGKLPGAKLGLGLDLSLYYTDAEQFFQGAVRYSSRTWGPFTVVEYYDECYEVTGHTFSIFGRGLGLTGLEKGASTGWIYPLQ
jgi:RHS repeat-associated protein